MANVSLPPGRDGRPPRIAMGGFFIECNRFAPPSTAEDFSRGLDRSGAELASALRAEPSRAMADNRGFIETLDQAGPWELVPLRLAAAQPGGPVQHAFFEDFLAGLARLLESAGPLDGVYISAHGAALTDQEEDPDGVLLARVRSIVGPDVPIVAVFDLHTNVSEQMCKALSAFVAYRTNPHVDMRERGREAARLLMRLLCGERGCVEMVKLPLVPPAPSQLVAAGTVYAELIERGQNHVGGNILNVSLCGGFALADSDKCGFSVVVSAIEADRNMARGIARLLARQVWQERARFRIRLTALKEAVARAGACGRDPTLPRVILADVADNPGAGGGGNTTALLQALLEAGAERVLLGVFTDPSLAQQAFRHRVGDRFEARINEGLDGDPFARPMQVQATVLALSEGRFVGRKGMMQDARGHLGPSALLQVGGLQLAVISRRQQLLDPAQLDILGADLSQVRTLVVKSRGHFRAAFDDFTEAANILEVDCPGLTTPKLASLPWTRMPRPIEPIDEGVIWQPPPL